MAKLRARIEALEAAELNASQGGIAERMHAARMRYRAMSLEEREFEKLARLRHSLAAPEPSGDGLANRLWHAYRREAIRLGMLPQVDSGE
jgi:hypothetical protein